MSDKEKVRQVKVSKMKEKNEKDDADEKITKMLLTFKEKDKQHGKVSRTEKRQISQEKVGEEDAPLPSLRNVEHMIDCENIDMEPGVVKVMDIALPTTEKTVEFDEEVKQSNEYSGNFEITDDDKSAADRYLVQQNIITTQPIRKTMNRSDNLPNYKDVSTDAPGNTPVIYHGIAYEKSAVDLFRRLKPNSDITQETETEHDYCHPPGADVGNGKS